MDDIQKRETLRDAYLGESNPFTRAANQELYIEALEVAAGVVPDMRKGMKVKDLTGPGGQKATLNQISAEKFNIEGEGFNTPPEFDSIQAAQDYWDTHSEAHKPRTAKEGERFWSSEQDAKVDQELFDQNRHKAAGGPLNKGINFNAKGGATFTGDLGEYGDQDMPAMKEADEEKFEEAIRSVYAEREIKDADKLARAAYRRSDLNLDVGNSNVVDHMIQMAHIFLSGGGDGKAAMAPLAKKLGDIPSGPGTRTVGGDSSRPQGYTFPKGEKPEQLDPLFGALKQALNHMDAEAARGPLAQWRREAKHAEEHGAIGLIQRAVSMGNWAKARSEFESWMKEMGDAADKVAAAPLTKAK